jgi:quercetin dioxygenase-like cupin family protein
MDIIHAAEMPWGESLVAQRAGGEVAHKRLFEGAEDSPDNYMLVMSKEPKSFFSPRHRHPWDQIRFCLEGKIPIAKGVFVDGGEIAYFPESVHYGPQEGGEDRIVVLLQFGGASGNGFIGPDRVEQARVQLAQEGRFEGGVYVRETPEGRRNRDAYEAIWLHVMRGELSYAPPVYKTPIVMRPQALPWLPTAEPGVAAKSIGVFPHRGLTLSAWRIEPGAQHSIPASAALRLLFVMDGDGTVGAEALRRWSVVRLPAGDGAALRSANRLECLELAIRPVEDLKRSAQVSA